MLSYTTPTFRKGPISRELHVVQGSVSAIGGLHARHLPRLEQRTEKETLGRLSGREGNHLRRR